MFSQIEAGGYVLVEHAPDWVNANGEELATEDFRKIYDFFVVRTPIARLSSQSVPLSVYGWRYPWKKPEHLNRQIKDASNNPNLFYSAKKLEEMEEVLEKASLLFDDLASSDREVACFYNNENNQVMSCFCHLRNSFCHGRYRIFRKSDELWIAAEDKSNKRVKNRQGEMLSARMLFRVDTLMRWIEIVQSGPAGIDSVERGN